MVTTPLSHDERVALLERLKRLSESPKISMERKAGLFRVIRLLSNDIARNLRKSGKPDAGYRIRIH